MSKTSSPTTGKSRNESAAFEQPEVDPIVIPDTVDSSKKSLDGSTLSEIGNSPLNLEKRANDSLKEIYAWIDQMTFSKPRKNIARDFSDGVFMAELLKRYYPRHVDLHNYIPRNSIANKIDNWSTLNRKVLSKIGMKVDKDTIMRLANSEAGVIETVLAALRAKILKDCNAERDSLYFDYEDNRKGETIESVLDAEEVANKTVPRRVFVKLKHELQEKKSMINTLGEKVSHLESLMKLKDQRIADLTIQITGSLEKNDLPRSAPFVNENLKKVIPKIE